MSIPVLTQVFDEVRRLAIAGSVVAGGDFRLKKLVPPLEQAGQKAPVFANVAQAVAKLIESDEKRSAQALLELSTLVNAILYTQGETGPAGKLEPIETTDLGQHQTQASARVLKPLIEALSTTGSGRLEIIREAHERGAFRDLRLVKPALDALDDSYSEIGDFIANQVLPLYGNAILRELRARFDPKGRAGDVRHLALMHKLDPEGTRETVKQALDEGSKEVRVAAIECLGGSKDDLALLLGHVKSKAKDVRQAALKALGKSSASQAVEALQAAMQGEDLELAVGPVRASTSPQLLKFLLEEARTTFAALLAAKKDRKAAGKHAGRMLCLLECLRERTDKGTEELLLDCFEQREQLAAIKGEPSGKDVEQRLVLITAGGPKKVQKALIDAHATLPADELREAFAAAVRSRKPAEVFELFSPYLLAKSDGKKKNRDPADAKRAAIEECLTLNLYMSRHFGSLDADSFLLRSGHFVVAKLEDLLQSLDPRWLDIAMQLQNVSLVEALARPGDAAVHRFLSETFAQLFKKSEHDAKYAEVVQAMIQTAHPAAVDSLNAVLAKHASDMNTYRFDSLCEFIYYLPKSAVPTLEALLPTLPERALDTALNYVTQLKNRPD